MMVRMQARLVILFLAAAVGCTGETPDPEPLDTSLRDGDMTAEFESAAFEPAHGVLYFDEEAGAGQLVLSTDPLSCPYVDVATVAGIHVTYTVSTIDPGTDETNEHAFWSVTESSSLDYRYPDGTLVVDDTTDDSFSGSLDLGGAEATLEGTFEVARCDG